MGSSNWFLYDQVGRVVDSMVSDPAYQGGTDRRQRCSYDRYGNLLTIATRVGSVGWSTRTLAVDSTSNRLTTSAYDGAGNQLNWGSYQYGWSSLDTMTTMAGGGNDQIYLYTADDERIYTYRAQEATEIWTVHDLGGTVLREWTFTGGNATGNSSTISSSFTSVTSAGCRSNMSHTVSTIGPISHDKDAPRGCKAEWSLGAETETVAFPRVSGLHHRYRWQAAA